MKVLHLKARVQPGELGVLVEYARRLREVAHVEALWTELIDAAAGFYDHTAIFVPLDTHRLGLIRFRSRDAAIQARFEAALDRVVIDTRETPDSIVATCFRTHTPVYIHMVNEAERRQQNQMVVQLLQPTDALNVPIVACERSQVVLGCINTSSGHDSLRNAALMELMANLTSAWYEIYARSIQHRWTQQRRRKRTLQVLDKAFVILDGVAAQLQSLGDRGCGKQEPGSAQSLELGNAQLQQLLEQIVPHCQEETGTPAPRSPVLPAGKRST